VLVTPRRSQVWFCFYGRFFINSVNELSSFIIQNISHNYCEMDGIGCIRRHLSVKVQL